MGAIADAIVRYAQPLLDETDGSTEQLQKALSIGQLCWNMALMSEEDRNAFLDNLPPLPTMTPEDIENFKRLVVAPMIQRHHEMFPGMSRLGPMAPFRDAPVDEIPPPPTRRIVKQYAGTGRNEPCPCGSGKKYKRCCGR